MMIETTREAKRTTTALKTCERAWQKAFHDFAQIDDETGLVTNAEQVAGLQALAYKTALPRLTDWYSIRAYIACVSRGLALGALTETEAKTLMYTAQTALSTFAKDQRME
jgi:hypothetical protein